MRSLTWITACSLALAVLVGCASTKTGTEQAQTGCAVCAQGQAGQNAWCDTCNVGYVDGKKTQCKICFQGKTGKAAWCDKCNVGYVDGKKIACQGCWKEKTGGPPCKVCRAKRQDT